MDERLTLQQRKQETSVLFPAEQATLGNLLTFFNGVETYAIENARIIRRQTMYQMRSLPYGEPYYMGVLEFCLAPWGVNRLLMLFSSPDRIPLAATSETRS
jgi:hypothetical protein